MKLAGAGARQFEHAVEPLVGRVRQARPGLEAGKRRALLVARCDVEDGFARTIAIELAVDAPAAGVLPLVFEIEAGTLEEALAKFPDGVNAALEQAIEEAREMRRESASRIVVPEVGAGGIGPGPGGPAGGGKIKFP